MLIVAIKVYFAAALLGNYDVIYKVIQENSAPLWRL